LIGLDWRMMVALMTSMLRSEYTLTTLAVLFVVGHHQVNFSSALAGQLEPAGALAFLAMQILFIPCIATVAAIRKESKSWRQTLGYVALRLVTAIGLGMVIYQGSRLVR
jgi:ferrous iron transport protein B